MTNISKDAAAELQDLLDRLGADLSRWPQAERERAERIAAASPEARHLLDEARALWDRDAITAIKAPAGLKDRIIAKALGGDGQGPHGKKT